MKKDVAAILLVVGLGVWASAGYSVEATESAKLVVQKVVPQSPAERAGIEPGDVLLEYNGMPTHSVSDLLELKKVVKSDSVGLAIIRDGKRIALKLPAGEMGVYLKELLPEIEYAKDAVLIEGIPKLDWSTGKSNSFLAAVEAIAHHLGVGKDYVYIYGVSGAAFRLHFHKNWCPSSPDPTCGYNSGQQALEALGLEYRLEHIAKDDTVEHHRLRKEVMASIDQGMPVIAIDLIKIPEWGIITGYQGSGEELVCRTYFDRREGYDMAEKFPWVLYLIDGKKHRSGDIDNYKKSFVIALENLTTPEYDEYASGLAAFDTWIEKLQTDDFSTMDDEKYTMVSTANAWTYERLIDDRDVAADYLERIAGELPQLTEKLQRLAELYHEESELLKPAEDVAVYEFNMKNRDDWSPKMREEAVSRLKKAQMKEEAALPIWREIVKLTSEQNK